MRPHRLAHLTLSLLLGALLVACAGASPDVFGGSGGGGEGGAEGSGSGGDDGGATSATGPAGSSASGSSASGTGSATGSSSSTSATSGAAGTSSAATTGGGATCGDGSCNGAETCQVCPDDCNECTACGDFVCQDGEQASCPSDCGSSSSTGGLGECPPDACQAGGSLDATCADACVMVVCALDPTCCGPTWTQLCADTALTYSSLGFCTCGG